MVDGCRLLDGFLTDCLRHKHLVVQIAFVDLPHIKQTEDGEQSHEPFSTQFLESVEEQADGTYQNDHERTPAVCRKHGDTHLRQVLYQWSQLLCRYLSHRLHLIDTDILGEEQFRHQGKQQGESSCQTKGDIYVFHFRPQYLRLVNHFLQGKHRQQGDGELGNDEDGGNGTELSVHRYVVEEEIRERHEVTTPRQQDGEDGHNKQCPFQRSFDDEESQHKEHQHEGTHIDRTCRHRLVAPVLSYLLVDSQIVVIGMRHRRLTAYHRLRGTALRIGYQQRPCLIDTIAPLGDIVTVQSTRCLVGGIRLHQLTLATHRLLTILPRMIEVRHVDTDTYHGTSQTDTCRLQQMLPLFLPCPFYHKSNHHRQDDEQVVVGHLHMVGKYLQRTEQGGDYQAPGIFPPIGKYHTCYHRWQIGKGDHLPDMPCGNDDEEIAAERPYHSTQRGKIPTEVEGTQQDIEAQQVGKNIPYVLRQPQVICLLHLCQRIRTLI